MECVRVRALKKRDVLDFRLIYIWVFVWWWSPNSVEWATYSTYIKYQHMIFMYPRNSPPFPSHQLTAIYIPLPTFRLGFQHLKIKNNNSNYCEWESIRFFHIIHNNQSLFGMPLSLFCNIQVPKIRNLFLESNIHFHHLIIKLAYVRQRVNNEYTQHLRSNNKHTHTHTHTKLLHSHFILLFSVLLFSLLLLYSSSSSSFLLL